MNRPMHCLGIGTATLKGGVILILTVFSVGISMVARSETSWDHRCCSSAKDFGYSPRLGQLYPRQLTRAQPT